MFCKHPATPHSYVRKKVGNTQYQCNNETSEERKVDKVAACASLNTGTEVLNMCVVSL